MGLGTRICCVIIMCDYVARLQCAVSRRGTACRARACRAQATPHAKTCFFRLKSAADQKNMAQTNYLGSC